MNRVSGQTGTTLIEVFVALTILGGGILALLRFGSGPRFWTVRQDAQTAYTILRGETDIMYANNALPPAMRTVHVGPKECIVRCIAEPDSPLVAWKMTVESEGRIIGSLSGLLFTDASRRE